MAELKVSVSTYNEIANALEASGKKLTPGMAITLDKDDKLINPIDWRLVTLRRDIVDIVTRAYHKLDETDMPTSERFIEFAERLCMYIQTGEIPPDLAAHELKSSDE